MVCAIFASFKKGRKGEVHGWAGAYILNKHRKNANQRWESQRIKIHRPA
jgi:hypothetical protein